MKRRTKNKLNHAFKAGITAYVLIMFGMGLMLYMFGYTNTFARYFGVENNNATGTVNGTGIADPNMQVTHNPIYMIVQGITSFTSDNGLLVAGGVAGLIIIAIIGRISGVNLNVVYSYLVPIAILAIFLNVFVFPIDAFNTALINMTIPPGLPLSWVLIGFFNLFFILAVIDYVRGGQT